MGPLKEPKGHLFILQYPRKESKHIGLGPNPDAMPTAKTHPLSHNYTTSAVLDLEDKKVVN
uniref:RNA-directed DNA polymerase n=1 Tax=Heterorhabditis bacteriophora TaxID=37862 RepID=A0A1I7XLN3_HETBA